MRLLGLHASDMPIQLVLSSEYDDRLEDRFIIAL